jgi:two-component system nitrate/nitrite response regulator NarL
MRVLIIDDHKLFGEAVRPTLEELGMEVVEIETSASRGLDAVRRERPELVFVDIGLPDESGLVVGRRILEELPDTKVVALTAMNSPQVVREAIKLGFHGYVTKDAQIEQFRSSIRTVLDGQVVVPRRAARPVAGGRSPEEEHAFLLATQLTVREREVLALLAEGLDGVDIARKLSVTKNTVRTHIQNILSKLQVHSRLEAAAFAVRYGIVDVPGWRDSAV